MVAAARPVNANLSKPNATHQPANCSGSSEQLPRPATLAANDETQIGQNELIKYFHENTEITDLAITLGAAQAEFVFRQNELNNSSTPPAPPEALKQPEIAFFISEKWTLRR